MNVFYISYLLFINSCLPLLTAKATQLNTSSVINIGSIDGERVSQKEYNIRMI